MKKIMFVGATLGGGGAERVMVNIANYMAANGHDIIIFCTAPRCKNEYPLHEKVKTIFLETDKKNKLIKIYDKTLKIRNIFLEYSEYTLVSFFPDINIYTVVASTGLKNKVVLSERNDPARIPENRFLRIIRNIAYEFCDKIVFQTEDAANYFSKRIQKKGVVIFNPVNDNFPEPYLGKKDKTIIAVGRMSPQKNYFMLLKAFSIFYKEHMDYTLEIYGRGEPQIFSEFVTENGLTNSVKFYSHSVDIYNRVRKCRIYASSSDFEGMSNTMLEAMALGTAAVVTDCPVGGARAIITDHHDGIIVPVGDFKCMAEAFKELAENDNLAATLAINALSVKERLSIASIAEKWLENI